MLFVFPHYIMATILHVKCDVGFGRENPYRFAMQIYCNTSLFISYNSGKFDQR